MVCLHVAVLGGDGGAFNERQQVTLHTLCARVGAIAVHVDDLVDLVDENDAVLLRVFDRLEMRRKES